MTRPDEPAGRLEAVPPPLGDGPIERLALTPREAATSLGCAYKAVLSLIHSNQIGARKVGKTYVIPRSELDRWLAECARESA